MAKGPFAPCNLPDHEFEMCTLSSHLYVKFSIVKEEGKKKQKNAQYLAAFEPMIYWYQVKYSTSVPQTAA